MTRDEIMAMTADQLNRAIAESKGWRIEKYYSDKTISEDPGFARFRTIRKPDGYYFIHPSILSDDELWDLAKKNSYFPDWSRDIATAIELIDNQDDGIAGFYWDVLKSTTEPRIKYRVRLWPMNGGQGVHAWAETLPSAISRAYLLWKTEAK